MAKFNQNLQNCDITPSLDKTVLTFAQILPKLGNNVHNHFLHDRSFFASLQRLYVLDMFAVLNVLPLPMNNLRLGRIFT